MLKIENLTKGHNRTEFDCGSDELNSYLQKTARQHADKGVAKTFVMVDDSDPADILGFFTLSFCKIYAKELPRKYAKKYPSEVPGVKLARLGVASHRQRQGLGTDMIINAILRILSVSKHIGIIGFFVDAKDERAKTFYERFGFIPLPDSPLKLFLPLKSLQQAAMSGKKQKMAHRQL